MKNAVIDPKDLNTIREVLTSFRTQICGAADTLGEPWKGQFLALKGDYDKMLSGLPPTDQVSAFVPLGAGLRPDEPAALEANSQLSCLHAALLSATSLSVMQGSAMASLSGKSAEASAAQLASAVGAEIEKQVAAGTLFTARVSAIGLVTNRMPPVTWMTVTNAPAVCNGWATRTLPLGMGNRFLPLGR